MNKHLVCGLVACIALAVASSASAQAPAGTATAKYNPANGNMVLNIGTGVGVVGLESPGNVITGLPIVPAPQQYDGDVIAYFNPAGLPAGEINLGNAFKPGLNAGSFVFGFVPIGSNEVVGVVQVIPEPATMAIAATSLLGVVTAVRRRRRS